MSTVFITRHYCINLGHNVRDCICESHIYGLSTTNISPEVINMIDMTWEFAQKPYTR